MKIKEKANTYDFEKEYKKLPVIKRVRLIKIARKLLIQQKENNALLDDTPKPKRKKGIV
jgi:hypothetical protein